MESRKAQGKKGRKKRKEKTTPFGVNLIRSPVLYRAAQGQRRQESVKQILLLDAYLVGCMWKALKSLSVATHPSVSLRGRICDV